jgi:hypothetical protein
VIRKSQTPRLCAGRVAMNQAVGKPTRRQSTVATAACQIDRQKIEM